MCKTKPLSIVTFSYSTNKINILFISFSPFCLNYRMKRINQQTKKILKLLGNKLTTRAQVDNIQTQCFHLLTLIKNVVLFMYNHSMIPDDQWHHLRRQSSDLIVLISEVFDQKDKLYLDKANVSILSLALREHRRDLALAIKHRSKWLCFLDSYSPC